jgi:S-adenosylmethionine:diacylglycerol 3-amino-3-carboxypropyl transferase
MSKDVYMFSQVREDPCIELNIHNKLINNNKRYLIVGSGGCTVLTLLSEIKDDVIIDVVDFNESQLYLIQLKISIICYFKSNINSILDFWEGVLPIDRIDYIFNKLKLTDKCRNYWLNNNLLHTGINQNGIFERLFKELVKSEFNFELVFDRDNLKEKFGEDSVVNSLNHEFYDHFKNVINKYDGDETNYFNYQILYNKYDRNYLPPYFYNLSNIIKNIDKINYINDNIFDYISNTNIKYDMIHTSNITDWMNISKCEIFLTNIFDKLQNNGIVIMRKLNGDYELSTLISNKFNIIDIPHDKSEFYNEVIAGQKYS